MISAALQWANPALYCFIKLVLCCNIKLVLCSNIKLTLCCNIKLALCCNIKLALAGYRQALAMCFIAELFGGGSCIFCKSGDGCLSTFCWACEWRVM